MGGLGLALSLRGRGGGTGSMVSPGDFRSRLGEVFGSGGSDVMGGPSVGGKVVGGVGTGYSCLGHSRRRVFGLVESTAVASLGRLV